MLQHKKQNMMKIQPDFLKENSSQPVLKFFTSLFIFFLWFSPTKANNVVTTGATIRINSGAFVTTLQNVVIENDGKLTNEGKLILKKNLTNQNTDSELGSGAIEFSGTTAQYISGQNTIGSLVVNNPAGLDIAGNTTINTELALQNGHIRLSTNNLTLSSLATVTGTLSASSMVIATGIGELRKSFSGVGSFTYPVGDNSDITEYSPVTISFTGGTFTAENYVGVKLTNSAYPGYSGNNLNRYWSLTQNGITDYQYDAVFQYATDDISENTSVLRSIKVEPKPIVSCNLASTNL